MSELSKKLFVELLSDPRKVAVRKQIESVVDELASRGMYVALQEPPYNPDYLPEVVRNDKRFDMDNQWLLYVSDLHTLNNKKRTDIPYNVNNSFSACLPYTFRSNIDVGFMYIDNSWDRLIVAIDFT